MQQEWDDFREIEALVTSQDRLDLHYEHRDALEVERGSWLLAEHLRGFSDAQVWVGDHCVRGELLCVGPDWMQLASGIVSLDACEMLQPVGRLAEPRPRTVLEFRQAIRQLAGRVPREIVLRNGQSRLLTLEWVGRDFVAVRSDGRPAVVPLVQIAVVFGRVEIG